MLKLLKIAFAHDLTAYSKEFHVLEQFRWDKMYFLLKNQDFGWKITSLKHVLWQLNQRFWRQNRIQNIVKLLKTSFTRDFWLHCTVWVGLDAFGWEKSVILGENLSFFLRVVSWVGTTRKYWKTSISKLRRATQLKFFQLILLMSSTELKINSVFCKFILEIEKSEVRKI